MGVPADSSLDLPEPVHPGYGAECVTALIPTLLEGTDEAAWLPDGSSEARCVVLLVLDGLGWNQLRKRAGLAPTLSALDGGPITTVAPTTTATALTSITTGRPPGEHGVVGYRVALEDGVFNTCAGPEEVAGSRSGPILELFSHARPSEPSVHR